MPVVSLIVQSFSWLDNVQAPFSDLTHPRGHLPYYWKGDASDAYQAKVVEQNEAINIVASRADKVSGWLMEIAKYNVEYVTVLSKMATSFLGALTSAAIEAATVLEIPFAVKDLAGAIGDLVTQKLDNLVGIANRFMETLSKSRDLRSMMADGKLVRNQWPQAVNGGVRTSGEKEI